MQVLALDISGTPFDWISTADAASYYASKKVAWDIGATSVLFRGGHNNHGVQSQIVIRPVIAIIGSERMAKNRRHEIPLGDDNRLLYARDRYTCAYCGDVFPHHQLSRDHVLARCRGGLDNFTNCVTACRDCNQKKGSKLVHAFKPLLYVPYVPCRFEHFILSGRNVIADQHQYLAAKLPHHSRLL